MKFKRLDSVKSINMDLGIAYALLNLPYGVPPIDYRYGKDGFLCLGRNNTCTSNATIRGYCLRCAYRVNPNELSVAQVFAVKGNDLIIKRNSARYIRGTYSALDGSTAFITRKLCCGSGNKCRKNARNAGLCAQHIRQYGEKLKKLPSGTILEESEMRVILGPRDMPVQLCSYPDCPFAPKRTGYCMEHFHGLKN